MNKKARTGAADLALIEPDCIDKALDRAVEVGVVKDDVGRFAPKLEREAFARSCGRLTDAAADAGRAGEGDLVDAIVGGDHLAYRAIAGNDVDDALGQARLTADIGEEKGGERCIFGRLQDDRVAHCKGGRDLPRQHEKREIPRDDLAADAKRLTIR